MKYLFLIFTSGLLCAGCVSYHYTPYVGAQRVWKTAPGCFVDTSGKTPIYYGYPPKPYTLLGLTVCNVNSISLAARDAREHGADALILVDSKTIDAGSVNLGGESSTYSTGYAAYGSYYGSSHTYTSPSYSVPVVNTFETFAAIKFSSSAATNQAN